MASTIPQRPSRPQPTTTPPSAPLPALPIAKSRKALPSLPDNADPADSRPGSSSSSIAPPPQQSRNHTRSVTTSGLPTPKIAKSTSTPAVPTLNTTDLEASSNPPSASPPSSAIPTPGKTLRKTASIGQFPVPPHVASARVSSLPPSPLSTSTSTTDAVALGKDKSKQDGSKNRSSDVGVRKLRTRSSGYGLRARASNSSLYSVNSPSLLNGLGDSNLIASADGTTSGLSRLSLPSTTPSSVTGSSYTDTTSMDDDEPESVDRGRRKSGDTITDKRQSHGKDAKDKDKGNVLVSVRVRPDASGGEVQAEGEWMVDGRRSLISYKGREGGDYRYDNVFSPHDHNARVYDHAAKRLVRRVMEGYHGTVFAYGMTGTGKTFSMQGTSTSPGVIPLAISDIFSYIREKPSREFLLRVSYLEIYNERIYDLLSQSTPGQVQQEEIKLREDSKRGVYASPLKEEIVQSPNQLLRVIARGDLARRTGSTQFNARSSRSHAVVQIVVESRERTTAVSSDVPGGVTVSTLSLIDLAGSEKAADNKERRTEGAHINKSLLTLGTVIGKLSGEDDKDKENGGAKSEKEKPTKHLPYRDSKLTRLLQPALSGNSLVSILCTIQLSSAGTSAASSGLHTGETLNTLKFASRAKNNIVSHAKRNVSGAGDPGSRALLDRYRLEIQELRSQLEKQTKEKEVVEEQDEAEKDRKVEAELERQERVRHEEQMLEMQLARTALKERIGHLNKLILSSKSIGVNSGRVSAMSSVPANRFSTASGNEFGRPVSVRSRDSVPESEALTGRESTATLDAMRPHSERVVSTSSSIMPSGHISQLLEEEETVNGDVEGDEAGGFDMPEGHASLLQQNRMLQADLSDKNRYIATLEKRLLQARRTSHSRVSMQFARHHEEGSVERVLYEKDREIDDLRAKLDDQTRMVNALRSAARKRDIYDRRKSHASERDASEDPPRPVTAVPVSAAATPAATTTTSTIASSATGTSNTTSRDASSRSGSLRSKPLTNGSSSHHVSTLSNTSLSSSTVAPAAPNGNSTSTAPARTKSPVPLTPFALLSPTSTSFDPDVLGARKSTGMDPPVSPSRPAGSSSSKRASHRRRSVDEMTQLLDQMIQDKVESGHVLRSQHGSLRIAAAKRDTLLEGLQHSGSIGSTGGPVSPGPPDLPLPPTPTGATGSTRATSAIGAMVGLGLGLDVVGE